MRIVLLMLLVVNTALGADLRTEASAGRCDITGRVEGSWWLGDYFTVDRMMPACWSIGVSEVGPEWRGNRLGYRAQFNDLGQAKLHEEAWGGAGVQPHWIADGTGRTFGASLGLLIERPVYAVTLGAESGVFFYRSEWSGSAYHASHNATVSVNPTPTNGIASYAGLSAQYKYVYVSGRRYFGLHANPQGPNGDQIGPSRWSVMTWQVGISVPL